MSYTKIPFIIAGLAILGFFTGFFAKKIRPVFSGILAWCVQALYVVVSDLYLGYISKIDTCRN